MAHTTTEPASATTGSAEKFPAWTWTRIALMGGGPAIVLFVTALAVHFLIFPDALPYQLVDGISAFTLLFVLSLAVERAIQPISAHLGPPTDKAKKDLVAENVSQKQKADAEAALKLGREQKAIVAWGVASGLGFFLSAAFNVTVLGAVLVPGQPQPWYVLDLLITGLVIGAGTKPLNDLVTRLQNKNPAKE